MRRAAGASVAVVLGTLTLVVVPLALGPDDRVAHAAALVPFGGCDELRAYLVDQALPEVSPYGLDGGFRLFATAAPMASMDASEASTGEGGAPKASPEFSVTNVQEAGVDEPDIVKTDGSTVYVLVDGAIRSVDVTGEQPDELDSLELRMEGSPIPAEELLLAGDSLFAFGTVYEDGPVSHMEGHTFEGEGISGLKEIEPEGPVVVEPGIVRNPVPAARPRAAIFEIDVSDPKELRVVDAMALEGDRVAARLGGGLVRLVLRSQMPRALSFVYPDSGEIVEGSASSEAGPGAGRSPSSSEMERRNARATELNREIVDRSRIEDWLPRYQLSEGSNGRLDGDERSLLDCERIDRLPEPSGLGLVSVVTIDPRGDLDAGEPSSVVGDAQIAYASAGSLYLAATHWGSVVGRPGSDPILRDDMPVRSDVGAPDDVWTSVHRFDLSDPGEADYRSSGRVEGSVRDQWAFSEHEGDLRVTATSGQREPETSVVVLRENGDRLELVGSVRGLGRGEQVYAVRYVGDIGFVVTFRQVDPLHVIDLSDPLAPRVVGELEIPGYSAYLHPVGEGRLLGVGVDATEEGRRTGAQVSLFDVTDLSDPRRVAHVPLGDASTPIESGDHHAFLYWGPRRLLVLPIDLWPVADGSSVELHGAVLFQLGVDRASIEEVGRVGHPGAADVAWGSIARSMVRGDRLLTFSDAGLMSTSLDDLGAQGSFLAWHTPVAEQPAPVPEVVPEVEPGG